MKSYAIRVSIVLHPAFLRCHLLSGIFTRATASARNRKRNALTYEELIIAIDDAAPALSLCSLRLLLHLISLAIQAGSNEVRISHRDLASQVDISKEGVARAIRGLGHLVRAEHGTGITSTFAMPTSWFTPQRSLFAVDAVLDSRTQRPNLQDSAVLDPRTPASYFPGQSVLDSRTVRPNFQDSVSYFPGQNTNYPGQSVLDSRTPRTQNEQLTDARTDQIRSDQRSSSVQDYVSLINQIMHHTTIPVGREKDAEVLREHLCEYMKLFGESPTPPPGPYADTLSRCLAIAPLENLLRRLRSMADAKPGKPREWIWFLIVFAQDELGIDKEITLEAIRRFNKRKPAKRQNGQFTQDLLHNASAGVARMR